MAGPGRRSAARVQVLGVPRSVPRGGEDRGPPRVPRVHRGHERPADRHLHGSAAAGAVAAAGRDSPLVRARAVDSASRHGPAEQLGGLPTGHRGRGPGGRGPLSEQVLGEQARDGAAERAEVCGGDAGGSRRHHSWVLARRSRRRRVLPVHHQGGRPAGGGEETAGQGAGRGRHALHARTD